jgi:hypothetical protein
MKPKEFASPLEKGDHPELDTSEICTTEQIAQYLSMIGSLQWIITIARFNIHTAVMTMSGFCIDPRIGHLERLRCIYGYLSKMRFASIRVRTEEPDTLTYQTTSMTGCTLFMAIQKKCYQRCPQTTW